MQHMAAGAVAGMVEHIAMYPVDTIKTRMQALSHPGQRVGVCTQQLCRQQEAFTPLGQGTEQLVK
jgi:solute carrier family 25 iron transporter 28/37